MDFKDQNIWQSLSNLDILVFLGTLLITFLSVIYGIYIKTHDQKDSWAEYILMGRKLTMPLFVATLVATWYGDILGVTQISFQYGVYNFFTQGLFWYVSYVLFAIFLAKKVRRMDVLTFPEILTKLIGDKPGAFAAILIFLKTLPVTYAIGVGIFLKTLFNISFPLAVALGLFFVFFYSLFGGFKSIVFSDFIQFILMYAGIIIVVLFSYFQFGGVDYLLANCPRTHFSFNSSFSLSDTFVWFFIAISTTFLNPSFYQRCLSAKSDDIARRGIFISMFFWLGFDICTTLIGFYAKAYMQDANPINASLLYSLNILPNGLKGLFLGGVLATILSTLDSFLFISSNVLSYDLKLIKINSKFYGHLFSSLITSIITFLIVIFYEGNFELAWRSIKGIFAACLFFPFLLSLISPQFLKPKDFLWICLLVIFGVLFWNIYKPYKLDAFYIGQIMCLSYIGILFFTKKFNLVFRNEAKSSLS